MSLKASSRTWNAHCHSHRKCDLDLGYKHANSIENKKEKRHKMHEIAHLKQMISKVSVFMQRICV